MDKQLENLGEKHYSSLLKYILPAVILVLLGGLLGEGIYFQRQITRLQNEKISSLSGRNPFQNKKIAFLGDSITFGYDPDNKGKAMKIPGSPRWEKNCRPAP